MLGALEVVAVAVVICVGLIGFVNFLPRILGGDH